MSKRILQHPTEPATGRKCWRSLGQLGDTPEFRGWLTREFPQGAAEMQGARFRAAISSSSWAPRWRWRG